MRLEFAAGDAARLLGLDEVGRIEAGAVADLGEFRALEPFDLRSTLTGGLPVLVLKDERGGIVRDRWETSTGARD